MHFFLFYFVLRFFQGKNIHLLEHISLKCIDSLHPLWMIWPVVWSYPRIFINCSQLYIGCGWSYVLECNIKFITPTPSKCRNTIKLIRNSKHILRQKNVLGYHTSISQSKSSKLIYLQKGSSELYNFAGSCIVAHSMTQGITRLGR